MLLQFLQFLFQGFQFFLTFLGKFLLLFDSRLCLKDQCIKLFFLAADAVCLRNQYIFAAFKTLFL